MTPSHYRMTIYRGDTQRWRFVLWADDEKTTPYDLTGAEVRAQLRTPGPDGAVCASLTCAVSLPNNIDAVLPATDSAQVVNGTWDLQLQYPSGDVVTVVAGPVAASPDTTRAPY